MSTSKVEDHKKKVIHKIPQIILNNKKITVLKSDCNLIQLYKEDLIYESKAGDFLNSSENICIVNRHNLNTNIRQTVVRRAGRPNDVLKTSDDIVHLIGQANYDLIFSALCSVFSLELKVRGILALLTSRKCTDSAAQTDVYTGSSKITVNTECQTEENCMDIILKQKKRKRVKRQQPTAYVVKDDEPPLKTVKKIVIQPESFQEFQNDTTETANRLPSLNLHDEDSNGSIGNMSSLSINTTLSHLLDNPSAILNNIQNYTEKQEEQAPNNIVYSETLITMLDGTQVTIPVKPEDDLHIATSDILNAVTPDVRCKLKLLQAYFDWKYCTERDEDGFLPLHDAVNTEDMELLKRQCLVLRMKQESVDAVAGNMTALQMSLYKKNTAMAALLLQFGADPLRTDAESRTCVHLAAEESTDHLNVIVKHLRENPMLILKDNEELWTPGLESRSKEDQADYLLNKICQLTDSQGYTPLMLASKLGIPQNVDLLVEVAPSSVNVQMPNSGNTALYLAVSAACIDATNRGNLKNVSENYLKIVGKLVENGADPAIDNHSSHNVNLLLSEFNIGDLSQLIANKMTSINCFSGKMNTNKGFEHFMLLKDDEGKIKVKEIKKEVKKTKPIILENIQVDTKIDNKKLIVSKVVKSETDNKLDSDSSKCYFGTFRNFMKMENEKVATLSNVDLTNSSMIVLKENPKRVRKYRGVTDAAPTKLKKIKEEKIDCLITSDTSSSSKMD